MTSQLKSGKGGREYEKALANRHAGTSRALRIGFDLHQVSAGNCLVHVLSPWKLGLELVLKKYS